MTPRDGQRDLPLASIEEAERAYMAAVDDLRRFAGLAPVAAKVLEEIIRRGSRDVQIGCLAWVCTSQRSGAETLGIPRSSFSRGVGILTRSRLVLQADGSLRLVLPRLVEVAEEARARAAPERDAERFDAADSLRVLSAGGPRPMLSHGVPRCPSASHGARTVYKEINTPVPLPSLQEHGTGVRARRDSVGQRGTARDAAGHAGALAADPAWRRLQTADFRPRLNLAALREAFAAAVAVGLLADDRESRLRFLATALDLAGDSPRPGREGIRSPAVVLRVRVERRTCYRQSDRALAIAKKILRPPDVSREAVEAGALEEIE